MFNSINYNVAYDVLGLYRTIYNYIGNNQKSLYNSLHLASLTNEYKKIFWRMNGNYIYGKINNLTFSWYITNQFEDAAAFLQRAYNVQNVTYYWLAF